MPKFKEDETTFIMSIWFDRDSYRVHVPKVLMKRIEEGEIVSGRFVLAIHDKKPKITLDVVNEKAEVE
ncbi:MAG: hypothetical protein ACXACG_07225 [Candidatus Thorarchaeota archaeon]|jgi:hypothetical protein